jgi:hypothetical protein
MHIRLVRLVLSAALLGGCAAAESSSPHPAPSPGSGPAGSGGSGGSAGSGGSTAGSGGGGSAGSGGSAGAGGSGGSSTPAPDPGPLPPPPDAAPAVPAGPAGSPPGCPNCKPIFDGKTLDGWLQSPAGSFAVKEGVIASTGKGAHAWTKDDYGDFRIFFSVRQVKGDHKPCTTLFNIRPPNGKPARGLNGIQFQPPLGGSWDYRPGRDVKPDATHWIYPNPRPTFDVHKWHRCEILARASKGEFRAACCEIEGQTTCKGQEVLHFTDASAGKKGPFALMMHNDGLFDEYKDLWVETDPVGDDLVSTK